LSRIVGSGRVTGPADGKGSLVEEDIAAIDQVVRWAMLTDPPRASMKIGGLSSILIASPGDEGGFGHRQDLF